MKVLLIGEYSRLHNSLKEGLLKLGHDVKLVGFNDGFKNFPVDLLFEKKWDKGILKKLKLVVHIVFNFDISSFLTYKQFKKNQHHFVDYDIVQLINENSFLCDYRYEKKILQFIFNHNKKVFLLSCGDDFTYVNYNFNNDFNKSIIKPYFDGKIEKKNFINVIKYRRIEYRNLHRFIFKYIKGVIASDMDYHIPLERHPKYLGLIPNPINVSKFTFQKLVIEDKIVVFHGINSENYFKKGSDYFETALSIIKEKYADKVEIITTRSVPYSVYITSYDKAHIVLDQVYAIDQGYNALEAMAKGKVVFTGAEKPFESYYKLQEKVAINAQPDVAYLVDQLSFLIENPSEIIAIGTRARAFVEQEHDSIKVAQKYCDTWK